MGVKQSKNQQLPVAYSYETQQHSAIEPESHTEQETVCTLSEMHKRMHLCSRGITEITENIALSNPVTLELCCNQLTLIPLEIGYLFNLKVLNLSRNQLSSLPPTIGLLTGLVELRASRNHLESLPSSIQSLTRLTVLKLSRNRLSNLPAEIGHLRSLISLDLSHNPLELLPAELGRLKFLKHLKLEHVLFKEYSEHVLYRSDFPSLKELAARTIVKHDIPVWEGTRDDIKEYLVSYHPCSFCKGPYFDSYVSRIVISPRNDVDLPMEHRMCSNHWKSKQERITLMFCSRATLAGNADTGSSVGSSAGDGSVKSKQRSGSASRRGSASSTVPFSKLEKSPSLPSLPSLSSTKTSILLKRSREYSRFSRTRTPSYSSDMMHLLSGSMGHPSYI